LSDIPSEMVYLGVGFIARYDRAAPEFIRLLRRIKTKIKMCVCGH
jgi:hypothetical protein